MAHRMHSNRLPKIITDSKLRSKCPKGRLEQGIGNVISADSQLEGEGEKQRELEASCGRNSTFCNMLMMKNFPNKRLQRRDNLYNKSRRLEEDCCN